MVLAAHHTEVKCAATTPAETVRFTQLDFALLADRSPTS